MTTVRIPPRIFTGLELTTMLADLFKLANESVKVLDTPDQPTPEVAELVVANTERARQAAKVLIDAYRNGQGGTRDHALEAQRLLELAQKQFARVQPYAGPVTIYDFSLDARRRHRIMPVKLAKSFPAIGSQDGRGGEAIIIAKWFSIISQWTWYGIEFDGVDELYGIVDGFEREYGYFSLAELAELHQGGLPVVERDLYWTPRKVATLAPFPY